MVPERWKYCVNTVDNNVGELIGHYYIQQAFPDKSRDEVKGIIQSLLTTYGQVFPKLTWLDETTIAGAIKKLKAIGVLVGYSTDQPNVADSKSLQEYYQGLQVDSTDFYGNQVRSEAWLTEISFSKLYKPVSKKVMGSPPQTVNAFYSPPDNQIYFPAGILQPPFYQAGNPEYVNYGAIGVVAGHEITVSWKEPFL